MKELLTFLAVFLRLPGQSVSKPAVSDESVPQSGVTEQSGPPPGSLGQGFPGMGNMTGGPLSGIPDQGFPGSGFPPPGMGNMTGPPGSGIPGQGFPGSGFPLPGMGNMTGPPGSGIPGQGFPDSGFPPPGMGNTTGPGSSSPGFPGSGFPLPGMGNMTGPPGSGIPGQGFPDSEFPPPGMGNTTGPGSSGPGFPGSGLVDQGVPGPGLPRPTPDMNNMTRFPPPGNGENTSPVHGNLPNHLPGINTDEDGPNTMLDYMRRAGKMFDAAKDYANKLSQKAAQVLARITSEGSALMLERLSENDAHRLLRNIARLRLDLQEKLITHGGIANLTVEDIQKIPAEVISALDDASLDLLWQWGPDQIEALCTKLMVVTACPRNLQKVLDKGVGCEDMVGVVSKQLKRAPSHSAAIMAKLRKDSPPSKWDVRYVTKVLEHLGYAVSADDIDNIPVDILTESLRNISHIRLPNKSQRRRLVSKLMSKYQSPTSWPNEFLKSMALLLEDVDVQKLALLRGDAVEQVAAELDEAGIEKGTTRIALAKTITRALRVQPDAEKLARLLPFVRLDAKFMHDLDMELLLEALKMNPKMRFSKAETFLVAERVENYPDIMDLLINTTEHHVTMRKLIDGFTEEFIQSFPDQVLADIAIIEGKVVRSKRRAQLLLQRLKVAFGAEFKMSNLPPHLVRGLKKEDIDSMTIQELIDLLPDIKHAPVTFHIGRLIVKKVSPEVLNSNGSSCFNGFHRLGRLAIHVRPHVIRELKLIPVVIDDDRCNNLNKLHLTKAQLYAVVKNIKDVIEERKEIGDPTWSVWSANIIGNLGKLVTGMTAEDIEMLPVDTELLSIIEIFSNYEDDLDSSQVEAIVDKIREYYNIQDRNILDDVDEIAILQIGRFLQYLNSDFELPKVPKPVRPSMAREMGKSSMQKIPMGKRRQLLTFALKNTKSRTPGVAVKDVSGSAIDEDTLMDLGKMMCGLTKEQILKLTDEAINVHIEDLKNCPFDDNEAKALIQKALGYNINRLQAREHLATMGPLLAYLETEDANLIDNKELASVSEHISGQMKKRDHSIKARKKHGFIRERKSVDEERRNQDEKQLAMALFTAMDSVLGGKKCHGLIRLNQSGIYLATQLDDIQMRRCINHLQSLEWDQHTAKIMLDKISQTLNLNFDEFASNTSDILMKTMSNLLPGILPDKLTDIDLSDEDNVAALGKVKGLTQEHLKKGFAKWRSSRQAGDSEITADELASLQNLLCGASPEVIESSVSGQAIRDNLDVIGKVMGCSKEVLRAYVDKLTSYLGENAADWDISDVTEMGSLIGGLKKNALNKLTGKQIKTIEPEVFSNMPADKIKDFSVEQLSSFTANQASAVTEMQRSYLSEEQTQALGISMDPFNGSPISLPTKLTSFIFILASIRQLVVCFL